MVKRGVVSDTMTLRAVANIIGVLRMARYVPCSVLNGQKSLLRFVQIQEQNVSEEHTTNI